jgi:tetratricopeptide (TPR) repeat protein
MQMDTERLLDYIQSQNFGSLDEINEFISKNVIGKQIDEVVPEVSPSVTNEQKANDMMYNAYDSTPEKGKKLAKEALKLDPENVRALNYLADQERIAESALKLYQRAMESGKRQLGEQFFKENKGRFWVMIESRPYMTAKLGFAHCLEDLEWNDEAINEYNELIKLNPGDNQGVRYALGSLLLFTKKYKQFAELYKKYTDEESTFWLFNYALYLFATQGPSEKANEALYQANQANPYVIDFMTQRKKMKQNPQGFYSPGEENEAAYYLMDNFRAWVNVEGTLDWLIRFVETMKK